MSHDSRNDASNKATTDNAKNDKVVKSDAEWREKLTPEQYTVTRQAGTERPFTGKYYDSKETGMFHCICCDAPLFSSDHKFDAGCGWPSFFQPGSGANLKHVEDTSHGMRRTEVRCEACDAHLGHVFDDGPAPTGQRYCINSVALDLKEDEKG